ncbi:MAG: hypothetical protein AAF962_06375 [Actinomycetota bacterium]
MIKAFEELSKAMKSLSGDSKDASGSAATKPTTQEVEENFVVDLLGTSGLVPRPPIVDPESGAVGAIHRFRQTIRWMLAAFAAVGLVVFGSLPFSSANEANLIEAVLLVASLTIAATGIAMAVWAVSMVSEPEDSSLGEMLESIQRHERGSPEKVLNLIEDPRWRAREDFISILESDPAHVGPGVADDLTVEDMTICGSGSSLPDSISTLGVFKDLATLHKFPAETRITDAKLDAGDTIPAGVVLPDQTPLPAGSEIGPADDFGDGPHRNRLMKRIRGRIRRLPEEQLPSKTVYLDEIVLGGSYSPNTLTLTEEMTWPMVVGKATIHFDTRAWERSDAIYSDNKAVARIAALIGAIGSEMDARYELIDKIARSAADLKQAESASDDEREALSGWWKRAADTAKARPATPRGSQSGK